MSYINILAQLAEKGVKVMCKGDSLCIESPQGVLTQQDKIDLSSYKNSILEIFNRFKIQSNFDIYSLSEQQMGIWYINEVNGSSREFNIVARYAQHGFIDISILQECFRILINRHDILKTNIIVDDENIPWQVVNNGNSFLIDVINIENSDGDPEALFKKYENREYERKFNLSSDSLIYAASLNYLSNGNRYNSLIINIHHIIFDGWSLGIFSNELARLYDAMINGWSHQLDPLTINYRDFSRWQKKWILSDSIEQEKSYWKNQLDSIPEVHSLPLDYPRPAILGNSGSNYRDSVPIELANKILEFAQSNSISIYVAWYTIFSLFIARFSNSKDVVVGTAVANREVQHTKDIVGLFINTIVLRMKLPDSLNFVEAIKNAKGIINQGYVNQSVPLGTMLELSKLSPSVSYAPLFQINFSYADIYSIKIGDAVLYPSPHEVRFAKFDLSLTVENRDNNISLNLEYNNDIFSIKSMEYFFKNLIFFAESIINKKESDVFSHSICHPDFMEMIDYRNKSDVNFQKPVFFFQEFENISSSQPNDIAVLDKNNFYSFDKLNKRSNKIANFLINEFDLSGEKIIAVYLDRNIDMVAVLLAVMKSGAAYMPLDTNFPAERLQYMLDDAKPICLITTQLLYKNINLTFDNYLLIDSDETVGKITRNLDSNLDQPASSGNRLAYVTYTSGSTGRPKGVMIEHKSLSNFLYSMQMDPGMTREDRLLAVTSASFDIHILELFLPLICGASLVIADADSVKDPDKLIHMMERYKVNLMQATPTSWLMLFDAGWRVKKKFKALCGGEALNNKLLRCFLDNEKIELWNMYGPTETTVWSAVKAISESISIGKPIANTQLFLLDEALNPVPPGCIAQLYIGGHGLARGYLNNLDMTNEKFMESIFINENYYRLYKTGDLCKQDIDGEIKFIGRADNQVKIRGFRIELAEIEKVISESGYVNNVCVVIKQFANSKIICAYITTNENISDIEISLRNYVSKMLPDYMIPSRIEILDKFPETSNKKIDIKSLVERPILNTLQTFDEKLSIKDQILIDTMCEVMALEPGSLTIDDNFYHVGGDSITAFRYIAAVKRKGYIFNIQDLIKYPCIRKLSDHSYEYEKNGYDKKIFYGKFDVTLDHKYLLGKDNLIKNFTINGLMRLSSNLDIDSFRKAFVASTIYHEIVRSKFVYSKGTWNMEISRPTDNFYISEYNLNTIWVSENTGIQLKSILEDLQTKLNLSDGIHYAFALIISSDKKQKLMFTTNHVIIDGYSNGIFLEDLFLNYERALNSENFINTDIPSIDIWSYSIKNRIQSFYFKESFDYWKNINWKAIKPFPSDFYDDIKDHQVMHESSAVVTEKLDCYYTNFIKTGVPGIMGINHLDFIISMIVRTLYEEASLSSVYLHVIDSGRNFYNELLEESKIDMSRVVSPLAELIPKFLIFDGLLCSDYCSFIEKISKVIQDSSDNSQTFKLLKYGSDDKTVMQSMNNFPEPDIVLNFLGMGDINRINENNKIYNGRLPSISKYNSLISPVTIPGNAPLERRLFLAWHVVDDQLEMNWLYSKQLNTEESIRKIAKACKSNIEKALIAIKSVKNDKFLKNSHEEVNKTLEFNHDI